MNSRLDEQGIPNQFDLMWPTMIALRSLGGSANISEIVETVIANEGFTEEQQAVKRGPGDHMSKIEYRLAWARNGLKLIGAIENSARGVWSVTAAGQKFGSEDEVVSTVKNWRAEYNRQYLARKRAERALGSGSDLDDDQLGGDLDPTIESTWQDDLLDRVLQMSPSAFERLAQRLLREADFRDKYWASPVMEESTVSEIFESRSCPFLCTSSASATRTQSVQAPFGISGER